MADALAKGGIVDISTDLLNDFATKNLGGYLDGVQNDTSSQQIGLYSEGSPKGAASGVSPSGTYDQVLPGNVKGKVPSVNRLQDHFQQLATKINNHLTDLTTKATQFQTDLQMVNSVVLNADEHAKLKAEDLTTDLSNLGSSSNGSGSGGGSST